MCKTQKGAATSGREGPGAAGLKSGAYTKALSERRSQRRTGEERFLTYVRSRKAIRDAKDANDGRWTVLGAEQRPQA
jgi:hypothetical protein